ncbi:hypothetical protein [Labrys sp. 22185]|uniref:hypothetical protein n=1 Tax=Labrys sp. 22185 TaxID=3453888 RepID=UPI003F83A331
MTKAGKARSTKLCQIRCVRSPSHLSDISDRWLDCEEALEPAFQDLVALAEGAGWKVLEITLALQSLADCHMLAQAANGETDRQIAELLRVRRR